MATAIRQNTPARTPEHRTVSRIMAILEAVVASEPVGLRLADLPDMIGAPKSSVHGLARGLVATGYLREHQGRYFQGPAVAMLTGRGGQFPAAYHHALRHALEQLSKAWNETAVLATLAGDSVVNLDVVEPDQLIRAAPPVRERCPLWPGSYGKVFLAFMDPRRRDAYLRRQHKDPHEQARILADLETIRATGVAFDRGESIPDLYGAASPITVAGIDVMLAIAVAGPASRMAECLDDIARSVLETARGLSNPGAGMG